MKIVNYKLKILLPILFFIPTALYAATLTASGLLRDAVIGEPFSVDIALITLGESVNAVESEVLYDRAVLYLEDIREDLSAIGLWLERPQRTEEGMVGFSGVIPGGSPSAKTHIITLVFKPLAAGNARIWFRNARAFLNDGAGTEVPLSFEEHRILILASVPDGLRAIESKTEFVDLRTDRTPPDSFRPEIGKDESVFDGQWFVAFSANDKGSGVEYYEVFESRYKIQDTKYEDIDGWVRTESPHLLTDQELKSYIYIRAVDRAGNERVTIVEPQVRTNWFVWIIGSLVLVILLIVWRYKFI